MADTTNELSNVTISQLSGYEFTGTMASDDLFLFSQSGTNTDSQFTNDSSRRFPVDGLSTQHISRPVGYGNLATNISSTLGVDGIKDDIGTLSGHVTNLVSVLSGPGEWTRTLDDVWLAGEISNVTKAELEAHGNSWPDYIAELEKSQTILCNPRYINNIFELSGKILSVGVNDISSAIRDAFDVNPISALIHKLSASVKRSVTQTLANPCAISATTDKEGRVTVVHPISIRDAIHSIFTNGNELSAVIPQISDYYCTVNFRDYTTV